MSRLALTIVLVLVTAVCVPKEVMAVKRQRAAPGSFLVYRADSVRSLVDHVQSSPAIAKRYAKHFNTTPEAVSRYFEENLSLVTLKSPRQATIYYVTKGGGIKQGKRLIPAGSRVFSANNGQPVLEWRCGNPLTKTLPIPPKPTAAKPKPAAAPVAESLSGAVESAQVPNAVESPDIQVAAELETLPEPVQVASAELAEMGQLQPVTQVLPAVETLPVVEAIPTVAAAPPLVPVVEPAIEAAVAVPPATSVPAIISSAGGSGFPWILPLLVGGGAQLFRNNNDRPNVPDPPVVPEPSSVAVLATGVITAGLGWRMRRCGT